MLLIARLVSSLGMTKGSVLICGVVSKNLPPVRKHMGIFRALLRKFPGTTHPISGY
jgi:hypothetical protein